MRARWIIAAVLIVIGVGWMAQGGGLMPRIGLDGRGHPLGVIGAVLPSSASPSAGPRSGPARALEPRRPRRLGGSGRHLVAVADERQAEQVDVGQEPPDDVRVVHPQVAETAVAKGARRLVEERRRAETVDEPSQLGRRELALAEVDVAARRRGAP